MYEKQKTLSATKKNVTHIILHCKRVILRIQRLNGELNHFHLQEITIMTKTSQCNFEKNPTSIETTTMCALFTAMRSTHRIFDVTLYTSRHLNISAVELAKNTRPDQLFCIVLA